MRSWRASAPRCSSAPSVTLAALIAGFLVFPRGAGSRRDELREASRVEADEALEPS